MKNSLKYINDLGFIGAVQYYGSVVAWHLSPNFRQNSNRIKAMPLLKRMTFVLYDGVRQIVDSAAHVLDVAVNGRNEISLDMLTEYTIRLVRADLISKDSVVYAFGVAGHIETEEQIAKAHGARIYMFDPTPPALLFIESRPIDPLLIFDPIGVWTVTGPMKFYYDRRETVRNLSVTNMYHTDTYIEANCYTLEDIMKKYNHTHLDVLKMDIEGSALPVLIQMFEKTSIRPRQILGSLEKPLFVFDASISEVAGVIMRKAKLFSLLRENGYKVITHHAAEYTAIRNV